MTIPAALPPIPRQWSAKGASVRNGEKGTPVIWLKMLERKNADETGTDEDGRQIPTPPFTAAADKASEASDYLLGFPSHDEAS